ncbi:MAG: hypothetical protein HY858_06040 [Candidatus Solibacter usitatus]|nr:hypothetical protein [Candidatus Solibacter usitatus]
MAKKKAPLNESGKGAPAAKKPGPRKAQLWNRTVAREIALDQTMVADADLDDKLGGQRVALFSQDARDLYRQRCVDEAGRRGHAVVNPDAIPADADTTVKEVGDALFDNARP